MNDTSSSNWPLTPRESTMTHIIYGNLGMNIWVSFRIRIWKYYSNMFYQIAVYIGSRNVVVRSCSLKCGSLIVLDWDRMTSGCIISRLPKVDYFRWQLGLMLLMLIYGNSGICWSGTHAHDWDSTVWMVRNSLKCIDVLRGDTNRPQVFEGSVIYLTVFKLIVWPSSYAFFLS